MSYKIKEGFDPHTPLRVDMRGASKEDHHKVQEIFFALGYFWLSQHGKTPRVCPIYPELNYYTNYDENSDLTQPNRYLRWTNTNKSNKPTVTPQEFYDMVLNTEPSFNLTKEHERKYFKNRRGNLVFIANVETELEVEQPVLGYEMIGSNWTPFSWTLEGCVWKARKADGDITEEYTPVFEHWNLLTATIAAIAKDANGDWFGFSETPNKGHNHWFYGETPTPRFPLHFLNVQFPECHWEGSLIMRPTDEHYTECS